MKLNIRNKLLVGFGLVCLVIGLAGITSVQQITRLLDTSVVVSEEEAPLMDAIMELKYWLAHGHLFFEEVLSGDTGENIDQVWEEFDKALWYCDAILSGGKNSEGVYVAAKDAAVIARMTETKKYLLEFIKLAKERYAVYTSLSSAGSEVDQNFDQLYKSIMLGIDTVTHKHPKLAGLLNYQKFQIADAHLFLEETLVGDTSVDPELVVQQFSEAQAEIEKIVRSDNVEMGNLLNSLKRLVSGVKQRIQTNQSYAGAGSDVDQRFDVLFEKVLSTSDAAETAIQNAMRAGQLEIRNTAHNNRFFILISSLVTLLISIIVGLFLAKDLSGPVGELTRLLQKVAKGDLEEDISIKRQDEIGLMAQSFQEVVETQRHAAAIADQVSGGDYAVTIEPRSNKDILGHALANMTKKLSEISTENKRQIWLTQGLAGLVERVRGELNMAKLAGSICEYLTEKLGAHIASFYILEDDQWLTLQGDYAFHLRKGLADRISIGQGLVGQAARGGKLISITEVPDDYIRINSSLGDTKPVNIVVIPFLYENTVKGVIELGSHLEFEADHLQFLENCMESIAIAVNSAQVHVRINELLEEAQRNNEELQTQQEELQVANEELEEKTKSLLASESELQAQQEELRVTNEELEERNKLMLDKQAEIEQKNVDLEDIKKHLEFKAKELETSSKYKSEFLANMSHELRTPLNSLLILAQDLKNNKEGNLTEAQLESAQVIYKGGNDLLKLINEILDLSKVEAGRMVINHESVMFSDIAEDLTSQFGHLASEKELVFEVRLQDGLPSAMVTDLQRLEQILRNLCSNAIKFTKKGQVVVDISMPGKEYDGLVTGKSPAVLFAVTDTGIGIPKEKHLEIFEAFQQVDGSTSREYGGTGLGLSISRELAQLLGGEIMLKSEPGKGATFSLYLPINLDESGSEGQSQAGGSEQDIVLAKVSTSKEILPVGERAESPRIEDDREKITEDDLVMLVIEDDLDFAATLKRFCAKKEYRFLHAGDGLSGLVLAEQYRPSGIILDIKLPAKSGWEVLESLKKNEKTRHIPVHIMSVEDSSEVAATKGAIGFLTKPATLDSLDEAFKKIESVVSKEIKELLVVEDDENLRNALVKLIGDSTVTITAVGSGTEALELLRRSVFDCMILDLSLPDKSGFEVLEEMAGLDETAKPPVIIYTGKELTREQEWKLKKYASSIILKTAYSTERLLDETALFLHKVASDLPAKKRKLDSEFLEKEFDGREILLVDDDMRNLFALSKILTDQGFKVHKAADGEKALKVLEQEDSIELLLMDIMMPVMDGYEATKRVRKMDKYKKVPIIALTAKAMPADRNKCIEAGASDYIAKPVEINTLLSLIRVWI